MSLVICLQRGRDAALEYDTFARLGPLLELFTGPGRGEVALVVFDSKPVYLEGFEKDTTYIERDLRQLPEGDGGAAILDAVGYSVELLKNRPQNHRRVLLLISESRDHGSRHVTIPGTGGAHWHKQYAGVEPGVFAVEGGADRLGQGQHEWRHGAESAGAAEDDDERDAEESPQDTGLDERGRLAEPFTREKGFENRVAEVASHSRNRYMLSFSPTDLTPGLHTIQVSLTQNYGARVVARGSYWAVNDAADASKTSPASAPTDDPPSKP